MAKQKVCYPNRSKSVMKSGSILKPHYIRFSVKSDRVISGLQCILVYFANHICFYF